MTWPATIALTVFALLQAADVITTNRILAAGGVELNPPEAWLQKHLGSAWWLAKLGIALIAAVLAWRLFGWIGVAGIDAIWIFVVGFNLRSIL